MTLLLPFSETNVICTRAPSPPVELMKIELHQVSENILPGGEPPKNKLNYWVNSRIMSYFSIYVRKKSDISNIC
jgi:hypothetical protein